MDDGVDSGVHLGQLLSRLFAQPPPYSGTPVSPSRSMRVTHGSVHCQWRLDARLLRFSEWRYEAHGCWGCWASAMSVIED